MPSSTDVHSESPANLVRELTLNSVSQTISEISEGGIGPE